MLKALDFKDERKRTSRILGQWADLPGGRGSSAPLTEPTESWSKRNGGVAAAQRL